MVKVIRRKIAGLVLSLILVISLVLSMGVYAADPDNTVKPDKHKPVHATDVEVVKKVTVKVPGPPVVLPGQDKKKVKETATGLLGSNVEGDKHAIIIGISDYPGTANDLNYCDDDARDMYEALTTVYGFEEDNVILLLNETATRFNILDVIEKLNDTISEDDEVVFFYSGHGTKGKAMDDDKEVWDEGIYVHDEPIWDGELKNYFSGFATSRIIFVFDTCLAGGMKKDLEADGRVIAMAATEGSLSYEIPGLENGEFTYYFVDEGMLQGYANTHDYDDDDNFEEIGQVTVEEAFDYAVANRKYDRLTIGDYFENDLLLHKISTE